MTRSKHGHGKMGYNSRVHDPPWKQKQPEPSHVCDHCGNGYNRPDQRTEEVDPTTLRTIKRCPHCDTVVNRFVADVSESYFNAWRKYPEEMKQTIDSYSELRDLG